MNKLTDLEIRKRIAKIEGILNPSCDGADIYANIGDDDLPIWHRYNPLTDDALCFQLMVKYDCDVISPYRPNNDTHWECQIFTDNCADAVSIYDDSPSKAICLAIIEAHED